MSQTSHETKDTKERLLDAAEQLFAHKGFDGASIRELAAAAGVNVAAVNYHFQGKENLFQQVIMRRFVAQRDRTLAALAEVLAGSQGKPSLDQVIGTLVHQYLDGVLASTESANFMSLIAREMHGEHTHSSGLFFREMVAPIFQAFSSAMMLARPQLTQEQVNWIIASIVGQIHHFCFRWSKGQDLPEGSEEKQIVLRAFPALAQPIDEYARQVGDHIIRFSTAAVDGLYPEVRP